MAGGYQKWACGFARFWDAKRRMPTQAMPFAFWKPPSPPPTRMCSCLPHVAGRSKKIVSQNKKGGLGKAAKAAFLGK